MDDNREEAVRRLKQRHDVAEARIDPKDGMIYFDDEYGIEAGPFENYAQAVSFLVGTDEHLVGMAVCPCLKCVPGYVGPR